MGLASAPGTAPCIGSAGALFAFSGSDESAAIGAVAGFWPTIGGALGFTATAVAVIAAAAGWAAFPVFTADVAAEDLAAPGAGFALGDWATTGLAASGSL